jgi:hypothetical protein
MTFDSHVAATEQPRVPSRSSVDIRKACGREVAAGRGCDPVDAELASNAIDLTGRVIVAANVNHYFSTIAIFR